MLITRIDCKLSSLGLTSSCEKVVLGSPCGAGREYLMQLDKDSGDIEILLDIDNFETVRLKELIPDWWGTERFNPPTR